MNYLSYLWIAIIIITALFEASTAGLTTIWFTIGGIIAFIVSLFTDILLIQFIVFLIISIVCLIFTRPLVKNKLLIKKEKTNADSVIGKTGIVTEDINPTNGTGQVKVEGISWSAKADDFIEKGKTVEIINIQGVKLYVK